MTAFTISMSVMAAVALIFGHYESGGSLLITLVAAYSVVAYGSNLPFAAAGLAPSPSVRRNPAASYGR